MGFLRRLRGVVAPNGEGRSLSIGELERLQWLATVSGALAAFLLFGTALLKANPNEHSQVAALVAFILFVWSSVAANTAWWKGSDDPRYGKKYPKFILWVFLAGVALSLVALAIFINLWGLLLDSWNAIV